MGLGDRVFVSCRLATKLCGETQNGISTVTALPQWLQEGSRSKQCKAYDLVGD